MGNLTFRLIFYLRNETERGRLIIRENSENSDNEVVQKVRKSEVDLIMRAVQVVKFLEKSCAESCAERCAS